MARRATPSRSSAAREPSTQQGADAHACPQPSAAEGTAVIPDRPLGPLFVQTLRHVFPLGNTWLDLLPDHRDQDASTYPRRFRACWGILLEVLQRGSRRQRDFHRRAEGTPVLHNLHRLLDTDRSTRPVHDTRAYFAGHTTVAGGNGRGKRRSTGTRCWRRNASVRPAW
jgi:hypothetical protein